MAKTPKNDPASSSSTATTAPTTPKKHHQPPKKVPFKKVFSQSQLQIGGLIHNYGGGHSAITKNNAQPKSTTNNNSIDSNRSSITSITSFNLLNHNNHLSSSLPGMFQDVQKLAAAMDENGKIDVRKLSNTSTASSQQSSSSDRGLKMKPTSKSSSAWSSQPKTVIKARLMKNIPIGAIEPSLIGSLSSYLADLRHFNPDKFIKEIELMLKYFEDAFRKNKLELLNGSCNILIETIAINCGRLRDAYLHLQQVQLRLQILSNIHHDDEDDDDDDSQDNQSNDDTGGEDSDTQHNKSTKSSTTYSSPIIEATNELNANLSDLVKWSDTIYMTQQIRHLDWQEQPTENDEQKKIPPENDQLIESGMKISRRLYISFKNLVKAYKNMELELRKCYEDYLYSNAKLAELIMTESQHSNDSNHRNLISGVGQNHDDVIQTSIQNILRRRSITPPPEYGRGNLILDSSSSSNAMHHFRTMANGSTSTISSSLSSQSTHSNCSTNSSSSTTFRTHRFIPNIISHQAQKMAQHFELKKFRNGKKDSTASLKDTTSNTKPSDNQTMLSFLFGQLSSSNSSERLKRSESASNIHRIHKTHMTNNIILNDKQYDLIPNRNVSLTSNRLVMTNNNESRRKSSTNDSSNNRRETPDIMNHSKTLKHSKDINSSSSPTTSNNSPKHSKEEENMSIEQPPPLPPKTYHRTMTTNNNSGRSSIASNASSLSSSSSLTSKLSSSSCCSSTSSSHLHHHHHSIHQSGLHRSKDSDSGIGSSSSAASSTTSSAPTVQTSSGEFPDNKNNVAYDSKSGVGAINNDEQQEVVLVNNSDNSTYSQVTLRPKKNRRNRTMINNNNFDNNKCLQCNQNINQPSTSSIKQNRNSSPPPLPPLDSMLFSGDGSNGIQQSMTTTTNTSTQSCSPTSLCSSLQNHHHHHHSDDNNSRCSSSNSSIHVSNANNCCCCCSGCCTSNSSNKPNQQSSNRLANVSTRQIRTYRKPSTTNATGQLAKSNHHHQPLTETKSCFDYPSPSQIVDSIPNFLLTNSNGSCCCLAGGTINQTYRRPSLMHSMSTICDSSTSPPPLPPKRNLHAYMGMVGNYTGPQCNSLDANKRLARSMFCHATKNFSFLTMTTASDINQSSTTTITTKSPTSSISSIPTTSTSTVSSLSNESRLSDTIPSSAPIIMDDSYHHLPMAPPPPSSIQHDDHAPSPPPILPPRRDKVGDLPPPPPPVQRPSITIRQQTICGQHSTPRSSTPVNQNITNVTHSHQNQCQHHSQHQHHCHHQHQHSPIIMQKSSETDMDDMDESDPSTTEKQLSPKPPQQEDFVEDLEPDNDDIIDGEQEVEDETSDESETAAEYICQYCSDGTTHPEEECILAQVDISPEMFLFDNETDGSKDFQHMDHVSIMDIRGASIDVLLIKATQASLTQEDETFVDCFLSTYRSFITAKDLLRKLTFRYRFFTQQSSTDIVHQSVASKVVTFITLLIGQVYIYDFDKPLMETMMEFIYQLVTKGDLVNAKFLREKCYEKFRLKEREYRRQLLNGQQIQQQMNKDQQQIENDANNNSSSSNNNNKFVHHHSLNLKTWILLDFKAEHLAEQMTLLDSRLFYKIETPEILIWAKEQKEECIPNLSKFTEHFNNMSYWARSQILKCHEQKEREKYMMKFLKIMKHLRKLNNFNSYLAILSALDCAPISRLDWPKNITDMIKEYGSLIDSSSSFRTYRNILADSKPPCIPYIGLILQDLTFVHIGNSDILPDGKINWGKHYKQYNILCQMKQFKQCKYSLNENENILSFFAEFEDHLQEDVMWQISDSLKPRNLGHNQNSQNNLTITNHHG